MNHPSVLNVPSPSFSPAVACQVSSKCGAPATAGCTRCDAQTCADHIHLTRQHGEAGFCTRCRIKTLRSYGEMAEAAELEGEL